MHSFFALTAQIARSKSAIAVPLLVMAMTAWAANFAVVSATTRLEGGVYLLDAKIRYDLSPASLEALRNGLSLTVSLEMEVWRQRSWMWDEAVANLQQRFRLTYHALARQYVAINLNNGEVRSFPTRTAATGFLGQVEDFPLLDASLLEPRENYYGRMRATLDIEALPAPLRPLAYLSGDWRLTSEWYTWSL